LINLKSYLLLGQGEEPVVVLCDTCAQTFPCQTLAAAHMQQEHKDITIKGNVSYHT
jgi:hypothetical protein